MKLASLYLDDIVVIPLGKQLGTDQPRQDLRDASFHASEGWDIRETLPGIFSLCCDGMPAPVTVGGYGYSYVRNGENDDAFEERIEQEDHRQEHRDGDPSGEAEGSSGGDRLQQGAQGQEAEVDSEFFREPKRRRKR